MDWVISRANYNSPENVVCLFYNLDAYDAEVQIMLLSPGIWILIISRFLNRGIVNRLSI